MSKWVDGWMGRWVFHLFECSTAPPTRLSRRVAFLWLTTHNWFHRRWLRVNKQKKASGDAVFRLAGRLMLEGYFIFQGGLHPGKKGVFHLYDTSRCNRIVSLKAGTLKNICRSQRVKGEYWLYRGRLWNKPKKSITRSSAIIIQTMSSKNASKLKKAPKILIPKQRCTAKNVMTSILLR